MKRFLIVLTVFVVVIAFAGCKNENKHKGASFLSGILENWEAFIDEEGNSVYLKDYTVKANKNMKFTPQKYAAVDFDGDNADESVLYGSPDYGVYLVFRNVDKKIYCFEFTEREFINLKTDGTFIQSSGADINSFVNLEFSGSTYSIKEAAYKDGLNNEYRLFGSAAAKESVNAYISDFDKKHNVTWFYLEELSGETDQ